VVLEGSLSEPETATTLIGLDMGSSVLPAPTGVEEPRHTSTRGVTDYCLVVFSTDMTRITRSALSGGGVWPGLP